MSGSRQMKPSPSAKTRATANPKGTSRAGASWSLKRRIASADDDFEHMNKVVSYIKRHSAQRPSGDVKESDWRYSLMNWGHDPCKDGEVDC